MAVVFAGARNDGMLSFVESQVSEAQQAWDQRYSQSGRVWSDEVNPRLVEVASGLSPGRALDLGCGEGSDAIWLVKQGWQVVAVDVSEVALHRAGTAAGEQNLSDWIDFQHHDLAASFPEGNFDLVSVQYLHSPVPLEREPILRQAASRLGVGGVLLIVDHDAAPPWAPPPLHDQVFPSGEDVLASLQLDPSRWQRLRVETIDRQLHGPDGQTATVGDNLIVLRRIDTDVSTITA